MPPRLTLYLLNPNPTELKSLVRFLL